MSMSKLISLTAILGFASGIAFAQPQATQESLRRCCIGDFLEHCS